MCDRHLYLHQVVDFNVWVLVVAHRLPYENV